MLNIKQILTNLTGSALPMLIILVSVPLYLNAIGAEKYGILSLVWIVFGYFGILDFGVSRAVTNAISRIRHDAAKKAEVIWSALIFNLLVGVAIALAAGLAFLLFGSELGSPETVSELRLSMPLMMLGLPILLITSALNGALDGEERFKTANTIQVVGSTLFQLTPLGVAYFLSTDLHDLVNSVIVVRVVVIFLTFTAANRAFGLLRRVTVSTAAIYDLLKFGSTVAIINIIDPIFSRVDQVLVAHFAGGQSVAAYNIAMNSIGRLGILPMAMSRSLFPKLSTGTIDDHRDELFRMKGKIVLAWSAICVVAILTSDVIFRLWLHNAIAPQVSDIAKIITVGLWANCLAILPYTALQAAGRSKAIITAHLLEMPFYLVALAGLTYSFGPMGAAAAWGLRNFADYLILWKMYGFPFRRQGLFAGLFLVLSLIAVLMLAPVRAVLLG